MSRPQDAVDAWNAAHQIGTAVRYRRDDGSILDTRTRTCASVLSGHTAVIWLEDVRGCVALDRVAPAMTAALAKAIAHVLAVYKGSDGEATKALYARLETFGPIGKIAINLFRACKASERAKVYRGGARGRGSYRGMAYDRKDWSIGNLARALHVEHAQHPAIFAEPIRWGWGIDQALLARGDPHHHVLYLELPTGQVSFHCGSRYDGPDYPGEWDGVRDASPDRICRWVARLLEPAEAS